MHATRLVCKEKRDLFNRNLIHDLLKVERDPQSFVFPMHFFPCGGLCKDPEVVVCRT